MCSCSRGGHCIILRNMCSRKKKRIKDALQVWKTSRTDSGSELDRSWCSLFSVRSSTEKTQGKNSGFFPKYIIVMLIVICSYSWKSSALGFLNARCTASLGWELCGFKWPADKAWLLLVTMKVFSIPFVHRLKFPYLKSATVLWTHFSSCGRLRTW